MMRRALKYGLLTLMGVGLASGWHPAAHAEEESAIAEIRSSTGMVEVLPKNTSAWKPATVMMLLYAGDAVRTGETGEAVILTDDGSGIQINRNSLLVLKDVASSASWARSKLNQIKRSVYQLLAWKRSKPAEIWLVNDNNKIPIDLQTDTVTAGLRGTSVALRVQPNTDSPEASLDTSIVTILEGRVILQGQTGPRDTLTAHATGNRRFQVVAKDGMALEIQPLTISPVDAVQWTLYVPPAITHEEMPSISEAPTLAAGLKLADTDIREGRITSAGDRLKQLTQDHPQASTPFRLLALTLLALNQKTEALEAAQRAVDRSPQSPAAAIVLSYAHQSLFDLSQAKQETLRALELDPDNVLALTNLAKLRFGEDDISGAWQTLEKTDQLAPADAEVHNLRGFIRLAQRQTDAAIAEFEQAIKLNSRIGEPHLGLGLALMRQGKTEAAMKAVATAVLLNPERSLFHSYWGKMLHQTEHYDKAITVLERAQELDPLDPTPELYNAMMLRDRYRYGEAIRALNKAIALNDNRAVYRSRFLLDQDLATRNVNLAILYSQLGLNAWARNKALASIKSDYANFDGHLFYAGTLLEREGRSYAFNSESLLARLLQPANINTFNNFNNYTALFEKPGVQGSVGGSVGNDNTYAINGELFGILSEHDLAFNLGGVYAETDGWRHNLFERTASAAGIAKWQPSMHDGLLAAATATKQDQGDAFFPRFEADSPPRPDDRFEGEVQRLELGYHRRLSPRSNLLLYLSHIGNDFELQKVDPVGTTPRGAIIEEGRLTDVERPYYQGQAHYTVKMADHQLLLGTLQYRGDYNTKNSLDLILRTNNLYQRTPLSTSSYEMDITFESYYVQDIWWINRWLTVEAAAYYDRMRNVNPSYGTDWTVEGINPRLGLIVRPTIRDTFRVAAFRYILPFIASRLDPTEIAGIQIFRNDREGSENTEVAFEWNHEWQTGFTTMGVFHLDKDYEEKIRLFGQEVTRNYDGEVNGLELEHNQLLTDQFGVLGGYRFLKVDDEIDPLSDPLSNVNRKEHQFRLGLRYAHPAGYIAGISQTYRHINNDNVRSDDTATTTDLELAYQFPDRRGRISVDVLNLFDNEFNWVTDPFVLEGRAPDRRLLLSLALNF